MPGSTGIPSPVIAVLVPQLDGCTCVVVPDAPVPVNSRLFGPDNPLFSKSPACALEDPRMPLNN